MKVGLVCMATTESLRQLVDAGKNPFLRVVAQQRPGREVDTDWQLRWCERADIEFR